MFFLYFIKSNSYISFLFGFLSDLDFRKRKNPTRKDASDLLYFIIMKFSYKLIFLQICYIFNISCHIVCRHFLHFLTYSNASLLHFMTWSIWSYHKDMKNQVYQLPLEGTYSVVIQELPLSQYYHRYAYNVFSLRDWYFLCLSITVYETTIYIQNLMLKIRKKLSIYCFSGHERLRVLSFGYIGTH